MLCVIARLDRASRARLSWIQSFAASFGIVPKPIYGHITLAEWDGDEDAVITGCKAALVGQKQFSVFYDAIEHRREAASIVAAARYDGEVAAVCGKLKQWQADTWMPETVLLHDTVMDLGWICGAMGQMFEPFTATVERIEFARKIPGGFEVLDALELKGA